MVWLLDLRERGQSNVTNVEWRFGDLRLCQFLQSGEEESQSGSCMVSSFACFSPPLFLSLSLSLSLRVGVQVCGRRLPSFDLSSLSWNLSFIAFISSNRIKLCFLCFLPRRSRIGRRITFNYFNSFLINVINVSLCADPMRRSLFFHFEESLSTDNIRWMLSWTLVGIIILCVR